MVIKKITVTAVGAVILFITILVSCKKGNGSYTYETGVAKKGTIINTITATGTLQADTTVLIGTQVSGVINKIFVDFNSVVNKRQLLAVIDTTPLKTQVRQAEASLDDSKGEVEYNLATYERYQALLDKKLVAQADFDQVKYNYTKSLANLKTARAGYDKAIVNLNYASIFSPIHGVILNRAVDQGQTVAASFSTPNLFTIANDLTQMHVEAAIDEADIGQVKKGQPVSFTVDAYPAESFRGDVRQVRLQPVVTSNVVTYTVIVNAPNPEKKLMPGMTANITVLVQKVDSVVTVPGKALRFTPDATFLAEYMKNNPYNQKQGTKGTGQTDSSRIKRNAGASGEGNSGTYDFAASAQQTKKPVTVWVKSGDKIHRVRVVTGAIDATNAEIKSGINEGDIVVLSMTQDGKSSSTTAAATGTGTSTTSPFMPQRPTGGGRGR